MNFKSLGSEVLGAFQEALFAIVRMVKGLHPKQWGALWSTATEILYGGAAGGGKSHLFRVAAIYWAWKIPGLQVYLFRRELPDLRKNHMDGPTSFPVLLDPLIQAGLCCINYSDLYIKFRNGSKIHLCHCQHEKDMWGYQGAEMHLLIMEEITQFTAKIYRYIRSRVRLGAMEIPEEFAHLFPRVLCGANPGGVGHNWVKATWVDFAPPMEVKKAVGDGGFLRQYIPAKLEDNPTLLADPGYEDRISAIGDAALVKAMRDGNWDIVAGGMFDDVWNLDIHSIPPFDIPTGWRIDRSFDWGSSKPFSVGFWAESDGTEATLADGTKKAWPRGTLFRIGEIYGWNGQPNEGCRKLAVEVARDIVAYLKDVPWGGRCLPGPADNSIFDAENGVCIADDMAKLGVRWERSDKSPGSRKTGWEAIRKRFKAGLKHPMEDPGMFTFDTCRHFIRTVPTLPRDDKKTDDVDTNAEDHVGDETRYRCLAVVHQQAFIPFRL